MNKVGICISHQQPMSIKEILQEISKENNDKARMPVRYIINKNATILFWNDGEKTIVRKADDDEFNARLGFLTAFFQRYSGLSKNKANKFLANLEIEETKEE